MIRLKRRADLLIDGVYKRITIWDALDYKQNHPELWEAYKENIYSICKNPKNKVRMVFQIGKNGVLKNCYFRYYNADFEHKGEGSEESYRHEFFKECISRIKRLELRWNKEALTIYPEEILQEETIIMEDGSKRIVDLLVRFKVAEPAIYVEKWDGQLAIEINDTHPVDSKKIAQLKQKRIACFEFTVNKWRIKEEFIDSEEEEKQYDEICKKLDGENDGYIRGELLVDAISPKYFSTKLFEDERIEKERVLSELIQLKKAYEQILNAYTEVKKQSEAKSKELLKYKEKIDGLEVRIQMLETENEEIKSGLAYRLFGKKK